jgi:lysophospholipase
MSASPQFPKLPESWEEYTEILGTEFGPVLFREYHRKSAPLHHRALFVVHGFGEQSDRFEHFPFYLHTSIDAIGFVDLLGHGRSHGKRGHIESFDHLSKVVLQGFSHFENRMRTQSAKMEFHWLGTSMGGLTTLRTLLRHPELPLKSVITAEAQVGLALQVAWIKDKAAGILESIWGSLSMANGLKGQELSKDVEVQKEYFKNPLNHTRVTPKTFCNMKREMHDLQTNTREFGYSLYMMVPLDDKIVSWKAQQDFFQNLKLANHTLRKKFSSFPNKEHELFNEVDKELSFNALEEWIAFL